MLRGRLVASLVTAAVPAGTAGALLVLAATARDLAAGLHAGSPPLDPALGLAACAMAGPLLLWLAAATLLATWAAVHPGRPVIQRAAARVSPALLRRALAVLLGAGVATGAALTPATAADHGWRTWTADRPATAPATTASLPPAPGPEPVVVRPGDTLWDIAARRLDPGAPASQVAAEWHRWYAANRAVIGPDPDLIHPGLRLRPPPGPPR